MATSGSKSVSVGTGMSLKFSWELDSQSVANNTSTVDWKMELIATSGNINSSASKSWSVKINGKSYSGTNTVGISTNSTKKLASGSTTITHNTDGTKSFSYSFTQTFDITYGGSKVGDKSGSGSGTLPTIARKSSVSATNAYIGNKPTITITRASSSFTHTLQYKISGQSSYTTIVSKTTSTKYTSWAIPEAAYNYISSGKVTVTIKCITYSGSTNIGEATTTLTATAKAASTVSATSANIGQASTITITRNSSSFKHTVQYLINNAVVGTIDTIKTTKTSISWTIPADKVYPFVPSTSKTVPIVIKCITYYGDVNLGEKSVTITATCLESACKPTLSPTVIDTGSVSTKVTGDADNKMISGFNVMTCTFNDAARNGATIKSRKVTCGTKSLTADGKLNHCTSNKFVFTVTDSRGYSSSVTITKTLINYVPLTCNLSAKATLDSSSTDTTTAVVNYTISGNYNNAALGATANTLTIEYRWKTNSGSYSSWTVISPTITNNTYKFNGSITGLNYENSYTIQARAYDALYNAGATEKLVTTKEQIVKATPIFDWGKEDFNFNVPVKMPLNKYYSTTDLSGGALNMNNSDIVNANSIYFADMSSASGEGLGFPTNDNRETWDYLKAYNGELWFLPEYPNNTTSMCLTDNKVLWSGVYWMNETQSITLSEPVSAQPNGIVLVWSYYNTASEAQNYNFVYKFIPKLHTSYFNGCGVMIADAYLGISKYVYINDTTITGNARNGENTTANGISYNNQRYVLRTVIGV